MSRHKDELLRGSAAAAAAAVAATAAAAAAAAAAEDFITIIGVVILEFTWIPLLKRTRRKLGRLLIISLSQKNFGETKKRERGKSRRDVSQSVSCFLEMPEQRAESSSSFCPSSENALSFPFSIVRCVGFEQNLAQDSHKITKIETVITNLCNICQTPHL
jgi:hypothetical protein